MLRFSLLVFVCVSVVVLLVWHTCKVMQMSLVLIEEPFAAAAVLFYSNANVNSAF